MKRELVSTIIIVLFMLHTTVLTTSIGTFACLEIEPGEFWLTAEQDIRCWEGAHLKYATRVALPSLLLWCIAMPVIFLTLLIRNKANLGDKDTKMKYGFLYLGYDIKKAYYWEFIIMYRKFLVAFVSVFLSTVSVTV